MLFDRLLIGVSLLVLTGSSPGMALLKAQSLALSQPELITGRQGLPQGFVAGLVQDRQGFIWMATHDGLCRYDGSQFKVFRPAESGQSSLSFSELRSLFLDHQGRIWIVSEQANIDLFDPRTETFTNISRRVFPWQPFGSVEVYHCYLDRQNRLWLSLSDNRGLVCLDQRTQRLRWFRHRPDQPHSLASNRVRTVVQDKMGTIWVATNAGLDQFQEQTGQFTHYRPESKTPLALPENDLYTLYLRPTGEILIGGTRYVCRFNPRTKTIRSYRLPVDGDSVWGMHFATDSRGVVYFDQRDRLFRFTDQGGPQLLLRLSSDAWVISSLLIDRSDVLWVGTNGSGIRKYDLRAEGFQTARYRVNFHTDLLTQWLGVPPANVLPFVRRNDAYHFRYTLDRQGTIWANVGSSTFYHIDPTTHQTQKVDFPIPFKQTISSFATDGQGKVWTVYEGQFWWYDPAQRQWKRAAYFLDNTITGVVLQVVADEQAFWLATPNRGLFRLDRRTRQWRQYRHQPNRPASLSSDVLFCLSADPQDANRLWIGTFGGGLCAFDKRFGTCRRITERDGLLNNVVYSAIPDARGYLWMGTNKGLCRMNRKSFQMRVYTAEDGLLANEFNRFHYLHLAGMPDHDDRIIMAGVEGFTAFQPAQLTDDRFAPKVELTALQINNQPVQPGADSPLHQPIQGVNELTLRHDQNFITAQFAALQYNRLGKNRYRYRLADIDQKWIETTQPQAIYTALPPGQYTLLVNASNTSGHWSPYVRRLGILIQPPWWATAWAYLGYALLVGAGIWYALRLYRNRIRLQQAIVLQQREVQLQQQEARQLRALDEMKSRFFTNITHDFRTPLTLILSPLTGLMQELAQTPYAQRLASMNRNAGQLLALINQLLDFSRLEANMLTVDESRGDLADFIGQRVALFREEAVGKAIGLHYESSASGEYIFDAGKVERIMANLLANALKFTPADGQVRVELLATDGGIRLMISDTGMGIPAHSLPRIFERFYQIGQTAPSVPNQPPPAGSGVGLALVSELVNLQQGQIRVESQVGQGTRFVVDLPVRKAGDAINLVTNQPEQPVVAPAQLVPENGEDQPHLLLVEDNAELQDFMVESLPAHYRISRASNGQQGLAIALESSPDLIISDVMMPVMDGFALCQRLKTDLATSHIPIVLLTAKATHQSRIEGLTRGADDYLTKPFQVDELRLRIHNLLQQRQRLREWVHQSLTRPEAIQEPVETEDPFLAKVYSLLETHLDQQTFGVDELASALAMSRTTLYRKCTTVANLPTSELIQNYRLKRAADFLQQGHTSTETAYRVGFDTPSYFARRFRELYGLSPSEYSQKGYERPN